MMRSVEKASEVIDQQVHQIAHIHGLTYSEALARLRDDRPELLAGFYKLYRQDQRERTRQPLFDRGRNR